MSTFTYFTAGGTSKTVMAERISFEPSGHVAFWMQGRLVLAVHTASCTNIKEDS